MEFGKKYSYLEMMQYLKMLQTKYSDTLFIESIGTTICKRSIPMLIFGSGEKQMIVTGGVHGRESINPVVLIQMAEDYLANQTMAEQMSGRIYMIPLLNPDGYEIATTSDAHWKNNAHGIDINRNFPSKTFQKKWEGDLPGSEEETKALMKVFDCIHADGYLDIHSRGNSIYYYRSQMSEAYNRKQKRIASVLSAVTGYTLEDAAHEIDSKDSGGNTVHFFSEYFEKPALTIETVSEEEKFPLDVALQKETYLQIKDILFVFLKTI
ncbi:MAG: M14 family zinc carboxypeptidase [Velocimicrobium sp.]